MMMNDTLRALEPVERPIRYVRERREQPHRDRRSKLPSDDEDGAQPNRSPETTTPPAKPDDAEEHRIDLVVSSRFLPTRQILPGSASATLPH